MIAAAPVGPHEVWSTWGGHAPGLLALLLVVTWWYVRGRDALRRHRQQRLVNRWRAAAWFAGMAALALALASPLDALAGALFSAHMGQHVLLTTVAAPLIAVSSPGVALRLGLPPRLRTGFDRVHGDLRGPRRVTYSPAWPLVAAVLHAGVYWLWHLPGPYEAALRSELVHAAEHATLFGTALLLWTAIVQTGRRSPLGYGAGIAAVFLTALTHGSLGAVLTFAPHILYGHYLAGAGAWGVNPLQDQHLAGVMMWAPGKLVHGAAVLLLAIAWLESTERRSRARAAARSSAAQ